MQTPKVSVVMPAYNAERYLIDSIKSVFSQTYKNIELIVVNDGSTDRTLDILNGTSDSRLVVINQENSGVAAARNSGIESANGNFIAFLDSDDLWVSDKIRLQLEYLTKNPHVGAVYGNWIVWKKEVDGKYPEPKLFKKLTSKEILNEGRSGWIYKDLLLDVIILTSTLLVRREVLEKAGKFREDLRTGEDYDLWLRLSRKTEIHKLKEILTYYRQHNQSITTSYATRHYGYEVLKSALNEWGYINPDGSVADKNRVKERMYVLAYRFAKYHYAYGDVAVARKFFFEALKYRSSSLKAWTYYFLSLLPR